MASLLRSLRAADEVLSSSFDRIFAPANNPWRHLGALAFACLVLCVASGTVAFALYDTSVAGAYDSGLRLQQLLAGQLLRGLHRYGADACMALTLAHLLREGVRGHYGGVRWFSWLTGVPLIWLLWLAGITGLWLLWDERALVSVTATAEWLQALPLGAELLARNFLTREALNDRFFSLIIFVHIGVPLLLLGAMWVHVQRLSQPRLWPPRALLGGTLITLALLSLAAPAVSLGPADTGQVPATISLDWFFLLLHPLVEAQSAQAVWWLLALLTVALAALPLLRASQPARAVARVDLANCNGCSRCAADCPFGAVVMLARSDGAHHSKQASVNADLCAACGICVGSCPSSTPFRRIEELVSGIEMPDTPIASLRSELQHKLAALTQPDKIVLFSCRQAADLTPLGDAATAVLELECAAMLPPSFLEYATRLGADGALIAGCRECDCEFRLGDRWLTQRLLGLREPRLRAAAPRERIALLWAGQDLPGVRAALADLRLRLASQAPTAADGGVETSNMKELSHD